MIDCCEDKACAIEALQRRQSATLKGVLAINAVMFVVELAAGLMASSTALLSDSLDNLGDALTYGLSLYAVSRGAHQKARVALIKGGLILAAGLFVLGQVAYRMIVPAVPIFETMGVISLLALAGNGWCLALLWKHRQEDINMSSVWECSRNDIASNIAVFVAAGGVWLTSSGWPDLLIGLALAILFLRSALRVLGNAIIELKHPVGAAANVQVLAIPQPSENDPTMTAADLESIIKCPQCGYNRKETMPTNACQFFYECTNCKTLLRPKPGDCCVFCSYGTVKCPPKQHEACCKA